MELKQEVHQNYLPLVGGTLGKWALIDYWGNKEKAFLLAVEEQEVHGVKLGNT